MIVIDSSVAIKWVVREPGHDAALQLFERQQVMAAPDLLIPEVANILRKKLRGGEITLEQAEQGVDGISAAIGVIIPSAPLARQALDFARKLDHSAYDCFFLAAVQPPSMLISADRIFVAKCRQYGLADRVALLAEPE